MLGLGDAELRHHGVAGLLACGIQLTALGQGVVPDHPRTAERLCQRHLLMGVRVEAVTVALLHVTTSQGQASTLARTETLQVRLAPDELAKLRTAAAARGWLSFRYRLTAQLLRDMIRQLPDEKPS